jgi:hypothetical protein
MYPPVVVVTHTAHEPLAFQRLNDTRHRRWTNLLSGGELAECSRAAEHEHRQSRQLRRRDASRGILTAHMPERVDRGRVEAIGGVD